MEAAVRRSLFGAEISREGWEAHWEGDPPPISDAHLEFENLFERIRRQGRLVAELARSEQIRKDLQTSLSAAIDRLPTWLNARVYGPTVTSPDAIVRDFAELVGAHREAILRVAREQVADPREIESLLADAQVPARDDDDLATAVGRVVGAHSEALILIAIDFDAWVAEN